MSDDFAPAKGGGGHQGSLASLVKNFCGLSVEEHEIFCRKIWILTNKITILHNWYTHDKGKLAILTN